MHDDRMRQFLMLLELINTRTHIMALDLTRLTASETKLVADVETLLALVAATQKAVADLQAQLAAAGTPDPAVVAALDAISTNLDAESAKVEAVTVPPPAPAPTV